MKQIIDNKQTIGGRALTVSKDLTADFTAETTKEEAAAAAPPRPEVSPHRDVRNKPTQPSLSETKSPGRTPPTHLQLPHED